MIDDDDDDYTERISIKRHRSKPSLGLAKLGKAGQVELVLGGERDLSMWANVAWDEIERNSFSLSPASPQTHHDQVSILPNKQTIKRSHK